MAYTQAELDHHALRDLLSDAEQADLQAVTGPFYPEKGITPASLTAYAAKCRLAAACFARGGAHNAIMDNRVFATRDA